MSRILRVVALAALSVTAAAGATLPSGLLVQCILSEPELSSDTVRIGEPFLCHLRAGRVGPAFLPRNSYLAGQFADYRDPGRLSGKGWLLLRFDRLLLGDVELPVSTRVVWVPRYRVDADGRILGQGHAKRDFAGWLLPPLWPMQLMLLPARGPKPRLRGEIPVVVRFLEDVSVPDSVR